VVVPRGHELAALAAQGEALTLEQLARYPIITYEPGYTGRTHIDEAFQRRGLGLNIVLSAMDADVIKTYVELGMGVGIIASMAFDDARDAALQALDAGHLFASNMTRVAVRRGAFLRAYAYEFIRCFAPPLTRALVDQALAQAPGASFEI
jgi:LysR family cys regulon transcriptional activator